MMERRSRSSRASNTRRKQSSSLRKKSPRPNNKKVSKKNVRFEQAVVVGNETSNIVSASKGHGCPPNSSGVGGSSSPSGSSLGLRQMSVLICEKVKQSRKVTCNEVADELLHIIRLEQEAEGVGGVKLCDDKNIRRRLYDALNVLDAVDVVSKSSKDITWKGMPSSYLQQTKRLMSERDDRKGKVNEKEEALREQMMQQVAYRNLVNYNQRRQQQSLPVAQADQFPVPFVIVNAPPSATVNCDASLDLADLFIDVSTPFALHDDNSILSQLGFNQTTMEDLTQMIPQQMLNYCRKHGLLRGIVSVKRPSCAVRKQDDNLEPKAKRFRKAELHTCQ